MLLGVAADYRHQQQPCPVTAALVRKRAISIIVIALVVAGCVQAPATATRSSPTPTEDQSQRDLIASLRVAAAEYDVVQERLRADVRHLTALRTADMAWAELQLGSITQFGSLTLSDRTLLEVVEQLRAEAKLDPDVQQELRAELAQLERHLADMQSAQRELVTVTNEGALAPSFHDAAMRASHFEDR